VKWALWALFREGFLLEQSFHFFIEIGSYLTEKEQKISWHSFLRHGVHCTSVA